MNVCMCNMHIIACVFLYMVHLQYMYNCTLVCMYLMCLLTLSTCICHCLPRLHRQVEIGTSPTLFFPCLSGALVTPRSLLMLSKLLALSHVILQYINSYFTTTPCTLYNECIWFGVTQLVGYTNLDYHYPRAWLWHVCGLKPTHKFLFMVYLSCMHVKRTFISLSYSSYCKQYKVVFSIYLCDLCSLF